MTAGAKTVAESLRLPKIIADASAVITGEGRYDAQSAAGKAPEHILRRASAV